MNEKTLCIYHGNCADGFGAAWVVREWFKWNRSLDDIEFFAGFYQKPPPDVISRDVIIVDFSYPLNVLTEMSVKVKSLLILDHHKTAAGELAHLVPPPSSYDKWQTDVATKTAALFDMNRSGAGLAWDFFFPDLPRPALISHIEDRDLWRFKIPCTREIQAALFSYPYDFVEWSRLMNTDPRSLIEEGVAIERKHNKDIRELLPVVTRKMRIFGHVVPVANLPYSFSSDAGNILAAAAPFAACYWDTPAGRVFSLRSRPDGEDVSAIAAAFGGGGHKNAAGFTVPWDAPHMPEVV
jgi:oligoribonuclease NrnB/cAMP/cGMP phosphodiesterase (DHH superfamily)